MFSESTIRRAIDHLWMMGDSDVLPYLPEYIFFKEKSDAVVASLQSLTFGTFNPKGAVEILAPKSRYGFRIAHQLTAFDNLVYLCAALECAIAAEPKRDAIENDQVFSYRLSQGQEYTLFERDRSFHAWLESNRHKVSLPLRRRGRNTVVLTDISDFYARVNHHRVENALDNLDCPKKPVQMIMKILGRVRAEQSFGIPVGTAASRMIAEALLIETDQFLTDEGVPFSRFVDDIRLFLDRSDAYEKLAALAQHLMSTEGLSLNGGKTNVLSASEFITYLENQTDDVFSKDESEDVRALLRRSYGSDEEDEDEVEIDEEILLKKLRAMQSSDPEISSLRAILRALRYAPITDVPEFIDEFGDLFRTVPRDMSLVITSSVAAAVDQFEEVDHGAIEKSLILLSQDSEIASLPIHRIWLKEPLASGAVEASRDSLTICDVSRATVQEKRQDLLIRGHLADTRYFRAQKTRFNEFSDWEKTALVWGASCLPKDEFDKWTVSIKSSFNDPLGELFAGWAKANSTSLLSKLTAARRVAPEGELGE